MRWKISHHSRDSRHIDLFAIIVLVTCIVGSCFYLAGHAATPPGTMAFIEPSQNVRW